MSYGFVYVLRNDCMPGVYKVGYTERSPSVRCEELSRSTGVPKPFEVVCYAEYEYAAPREFEIHQELSRYRVSEAREFFECDLKIITDLVLDQTEYVNAADRMLDWYLALESPMYARERGRKPALRAVGSSATRGFE